MIRIAIRGFTWFIAGPVSKVRPTGFSAPKYRRANVSLTIAAFGYPWSQRKSRPFRSCSFIVSNHPGDTPRSHVLLVQVPSGDRPFAQTNRVCAWKLINACSASAADCTPGSDLSCCVTSYQSEPLRFALVADSSVRTRADEKPVG